MRSSYRERVLKGSSAIKRHSANCYEVFDTICAKSQSGRPQDGPKRTLTVCDCVFATVPGQVH